VTRALGKSRKRRARITDSPLPFTAGHRRALVGTTALRQLIFLGFSRRAAAGHGRGPTGKSNPTKHMHPDRRRCFYLAVHKSGNRAPLGQSDKRAVRGKQGSDEGLTRNLHRASKQRPIFGIRCRRTVHVRSARRLLGSAPRVPSSCMGVCPRRARCPTYPFSGEGSAAASTLGTLCAAA
jgi:hypothetical protein